MCSKKGRLTSVDDVVNEYPNPYSSSSVAQKTDSQIRVLMYKKEKNPTGVSETINRYLSTFSCTREEGTAPQWRQKD
jgi:hypothetical protein